jgi:hypothetical protein
MGFGGKAAAYTDGKSNFAPASILTKGRSEGQIIDLRI